MLNKKGNVNRKGNANKKGNVNKKRKVNKLLSFSNRFKIFVKNTSVV
jgi:hypothetical protein